MKVLHITPSSNGYEEVILLKSRISENNHLALIEKADGVSYMTGGFLLHDNPIIRKTLDSMPKSEQYDFVKEFNSRPFKAQ